MIFLFAYRTEARKKRIKDLLQKIFYGSEADRRFKEFLEDYKQYWLQADQEGRVFYDKELGWCMESPAFWTLKMAETEAEVVEQTLLLDYKPSPDKIQL